MFQTSFLFSRIFTNTTSLLQQKEDESEINNSIEKYEICLNNKCNINNKKY